MLLRGLCLARRPLLHTVGLDVSTRSTGLCVLNEEGRVVHCEAVATGKAGDVFDAAAAVRGRLAAVREAFGGEGGQEVQWAVGVEEYLRSFGNQRFNMTYLFTLAETNALVVDAARRVFARDDGLRLAVRPWRVPAASVRKMFGLKAERKRADAESPGRDIKTVVLEHVQRDMLPLLPGDEPWPTVAKSDKPHESCYDMADAVLVAAYTYRAARARMALVDDADAWLAFGQRYLDAQRPRLVREEALFAAQLARGNVDADTAANVDADARAVVASRAKKVRRSKSDRSDAFSDIIACPHARDVGAMGELAQPLVHPPPPEPADARARRAFRRAWDAHVLDRQDALWTAYVRHVRVAEGIPA